MDDFWHAVAMLRLDRPFGLAELSSCFAGGKAAAGLVGFRRGRLLATTCGYGLDGAFEAMARVWMPWRGKSLSPQAAEGLNPGVRRLAGTYAARAQSPALQRCWSENRGF